MNPIRTGAVLIVLLVMLLWQRGTFDSMPKLSRPSPDVLVVEQGSGNHTRYDVGPSASFSSTSIGYDFQGTGVGGGFLSQMGGRGLISYLDSAAYAQAVASTKSTGQCFGSCLSAYESSGRLGHLVLIPESPEAMATMRKAKVPSGTRFHLNGHQLDLVSVISDGQRGRIDMRNTRFFLVESIKRD